MAAIHMHRKASRKLRNWSAKRQSVPPTAECMTVMPNKAISTSSASNGQSNAVKALISHCNRRSEEHTSELQSLMRISYAVFCLKKKITKKNEHNKNKTSTQKYRRI